MEKAGGGKWTHVRVGKALARQRCYVYRLPTHIRLSRIVLVGGGGVVTAVVQGQLLGGKQGASKNIIYTKTPVQLVQIVEQEPGAIGFAQLELAREQIARSTAKPK